MKCVYLFTSSQRFTFRKELQQWKQKTKLPLNLVKLNVKLCSPPYTLETSYQLPISLSLKPLAAQHMLIQDDDTLP